jgi:hypothetical protein
MNSLWHDMANESTCLVARWCDPHPGAQVPSAARDLRHGEGIGIISGTVLYAYLKFFPEGEYLTGKCVSSGRKLRPAAPVVVAEPAEIRRFARRSCSVHTGRKREVLAAKGFRQHPDRKT